MSCMLTRKSSSNAGDRWFPASSARLCVTSDYAVPPPSALICNSATLVRIRLSAICRAATGIVPSASPRLAIAGSVGKRPACCPWPIPTWSSPCRSNWHPSHSATNACSTTCCFVPPQKPCCRSPLIHAISAPASGCSPYSIPGARTCVTILTCIALVPAGGLALDHARWIACRAGFFLPVRVLSRLFRGKMLAFLQQVYKKGELRCLGTTANLAEPRQFHSLLRRLRSQEWVVMPNRPSADPSMC